MSTSTINWSFYGPAIGCGVTGIIGIGAGVGSNSPGLWGVAIAVLLVGIVLTITGIVDSQKKKQVLCSTNAQCRFPDICDVNGKCISPPSCGSSRSRGQRGVCPPGTMCDTNNKCVYSGSRYILGLSKWEKENQ